MHLLIYAKTYRTLINTQVGIKEIVYYIFKEIILKTNYKNIDLDLLKYYITLFAIWHLTDGGINLRFTKSYTSFANISPNFKQLFSNWYITENKFSKKDNEDYDIIGKIKIFLYIN